MADLIEGLLDAAKTELRRQIDEGKPGPYLDTRDDREWIIDGPVDVCALVDAVAREVLVALLEPSVAMDLAAQHAMLAPRCNPTMLRGPMIRAFAREHGLEVPATAPHEPATGHPAFEAAPDAPEPEQATEGPAMPAYRTPGGHAAELPPKETDRG